MGVELWHRRSIWYLGKLFLLAEAQSSHLYIGIIIVLAPWGVVRADEFISVRHLVTARSKRNANVCFCHDPRRGN